MLLSIHVSNEMLTSLLNHDLFSVFDVTIILTILINCVFLALDDPVDELEYVFTAIYTLEVVIKVSVSLFYHRIKPKTTTFLQGYCSRIYLEQIYIST